MKVWLVYQGWQNDTESVIGVYANEKLAEEREILEESSNDESRIYFYHEGFDVLGLKDVAS